MRATLRIAQTIYAKPAIGGHQPGFPPIFPFWSPDAQPLWVTDSAGKTVVALSGTISDLIIDLTRALPSEKIAYARVWLNAANGVDPWPMSKLFFPPVIQGLKIRQRLLSLSPNGAYVAFVLIRTPAGRDLRWVAPFYAQVAGPVGNFLTDDGHPPLFLTDDNGIPLTADPI